MHPVHVDKSEKDLMPDVLYDRRVFRKVFMDSVAAGLDISEANALAEAAAEKMARKAQDRLREREPGAEVDIVTELKTKQVELLDAMDAEKYAEADLGKIASTLAVITDRLRLYEGKPTAITENRPNLSEDDRSKILEIIRKAGRGKVVATYGGDDGMGDGRQGP